MAGSATVGALRVVLGLDSGAFTDGLKGAQRQLKQVGGQMQSVGAGLATAGAAATAGITAPFIALGFHLLQGSQDAAAAAAQVNAALTSMGGASGKTSEELAKTAEALRDLTGIDDDLILQDVTANLLTFGNIAGPTFDRAQAAILDLSARLGGDLQSATLMVGKALNDPVRGLTALRRTGIQFTAQQEEQIKAMAAVGDTAGAQAVMLAELERQFGGAAKAAADADMWTPLKTALMDLEGAFEPIVRDVVTPLVAKVAELARSFANVNPEVLKFVAVGAAIAAAIGPMLIALGAMVASAGALTAAFAGGGFLAGILPFLGPIGLGIAAVTAAFVLWGDEIVPMLQVFAGQLAETLGPKIQPLLAAVNGAVQALGGVFAAIFAGGDGSASVNLKAFGEVIARVLGAAVDLVTGAVNVITQIFRALGALLRGDFSTMWNALGSAVRALVTGVLNAFETLFPGVIGSVSKLVEGVTTWLRERLGAVLQWVIDKAKAVGDAFFKLYDAVVGHSYIPDMVEEIGDWIAKLQGNMVAPVEGMTSQAAAAFDGMSSDINSTLEGLFKSIGSKDWKGVLGSLLELGGSAGGGQFSKWTDIGKSVLNAFGGGLPGFKTGGSFTVGGSGGADSQITAFRSTPGEMVDVRRPGQTSGGAGGYFDLRGAVMTADLLEQMNRIGQTSESNANHWSTSNVPGLSQSQTAKQQQYTVGRKRR
ncbi:hypothetical protein GCM10017620_24610 [Brevundimonas intermedia]|uniref:Phage tail tape measure protein n=1 Tax=Brevundimonas intermedia TaxID=74315 RepID=A0ABQ5TAS9_9CAUL|nr:phage tail length tape measure family protein [Brevundimonas intermedia]GLK49488.1 hypothetical protein GCM10017620_24610 [Brevundimonas intermedia]